MDLLKSMSHNRSEVAQDFNPTFAAASPPYGGFSRAPRRAPSGSPPLDSCRICDARDWTSEVVTGATGERREATSKLAGDSESRRSTLIVRQFCVDMMDRRDGLVKSGGVSNTQQDCAIKMNATEETVEAVIIDETQGTYCCRRQCQERRAQKKRILMEALSGRQ